MKTRFYTGRGDKGESVFGKIVLPKSDPVFEAMGSLDELIAVIGWCQVESGKNPSAGGKKISDLLKKVQEILFIIQAEIASARFNFHIEKRVSENEVVFLEKKILDIDGEIPEIKKFIIPGGSELASRLDIARTAARKTERTVAKFKEKISPDAMKFLNRLSSALFALSRFVNYKLKIKEENPKY